MSPLPTHLVDRWRDGRGAADPRAGTLYWHILLGSNAQLRKTARTAQDRLAKFTGLHMTPLQWLHLTVLIAGPASQISAQAVDEMVAIARLSITGTAPITVELSRIIYHPEAIVLAAQPTEALSPIRDAARQATLAVTGHEGVAERSSPTWTPHVTLCYSTSAQPAEPIIAALGKRLPDCQITIDAFNLVIQYGAEWLWNWSPVGTVPMPSSLPARFGTSRRLTFAYVFQGPSPSGAPRTVNAWAQTRCGPAGPRAIGSAAAAAEPLLTGMMAVRPSRTTPTAFLLDVNRWLEHSGVTIR
jgi:2'-5' RNA ligase